MISSITPETYTVHEYQYFNNTYSLTYVDEPILPQINQVTVKSPQGKSFRDQLTITVHNPYTVTIRGKFVGVFNREIHYIGADKKQYQTTDWSQIPPDFDTIFKYKAANPSVITMTVTFFTSEGTVTSTIDVDTNWKTANQQLHDYIQKGKY